MVQRTFRFPVTAPNLEAPSWFTAQTPGQWFAVPNVSASVGGAQTLGSKGALLPILSAYQGACVDNTRGEYLLPANGGHGDGEENDVWALRVKAETPQWYKLTQTTPSGSWLTTELSNLSEAKYLDGRPRAMHSWHKPVFFEDRIWYVAQPSYVSGNGSSTGAVWSFNRNYAGVPQSPDQPALAWSNDPGPWTFHRMQIASSAFSETGHKGPAVLAAGQRKIYDIRPTSSLSWWRAISMDTMLSAYPAGASVDRYPTAVTSGAGVEQWTKTGAPNLALGSGPAVYLDDFGIVMVVSNDAALPNQVYLLDTNNMTQGWVAKTTNSVDFDTPNRRTSVTGVLPVDYGLVYQSNAGNRAVLAQETILSGRTIWKLSWTPEGDPMNATFTWTPVTPSGGVTPTNPLTVASGDHGTNSKFNIIDMGGGEKALIVCNVLTDVFMLRLPSGGL